MLFKDTVKKMKRKATEWEKSCNIYASIYTSFHIYKQCIWASFVAQLVTNSPAMQETWACSLGWEDPLEKGQATYSSILAWRIPQTV